MTTQTIKKPMIKCSKCHGQMAHTFDGNLPVIACIQCGHRVYLDRFGNPMQSVYYQHLTTPSEPFRIILGQAELDRLILIDKDGETMAKNMVWDNEKKRMVKVGATKKGESKIRVAIPADIAEQVKAIALEDGYSFEGVSYVTEKVKDAKTGKEKTKKDKDGKPVFKLDKDGKKITEKVPNSTGKINTAIADYTAVALRTLIAERKAVATNTPKQ